MQASARWTAGSDEDTIVWMSTGKVTFISLTSDASDSLAWRATCAIAEADFVIWTSGTVFPDVLRHVRQEEIVEQLDRCADLGLVTEIVRP